MIKDTYVSPFIVSMEQLRGASPVVGFLAAYAAARAVTKVMEARPIEKLQCLQKHSKKGSCIINICREM